MQELIGGQSDPQQFVDTLQKNLVDPNATTIRGSPVKLYDATFAIGARSILMPARDMTHPQLAVGHELAKDRLELGDPPSDALGPKWKLGSIRARCMEVRCVFRRVECMQHDPELMVSR